MALATSNTPFGWNRFIILEPQKSWGVVRAVDLSVGREQEPAVAVRVGEAAVQPALERAAEGLIEEKSRRDSNVIILLVIRIQLHEVILSGKDCKMNSF
jgi:hypothetical protein